MGKRDTLKEFIINEIRTGRLKHGDKLYSRAAFMEKFGCARATVDLVISDLVGSNILVSEKGRGTFVTSPAKRPAGKNIAVVAPHINHPASMPQQIINGFLEGSGTSAVIRYFTFDELKHPNSWETCKVQRGVVFVQPDVQHSPLLDEARTKKIPHLLLYRDHPESSFISIDNREGVARLVDALAAQGRKRIAYAGVRQGRYHFPEQRYSGYLEGLLRNNLPFNKTWAGLYPNSGRDAFLEDLFCSETRPDAIISSETPLGLILKTAEKYGVVVKRDFDLASVDEIQPNTYSFPVFSLKSVTGEVGRQGAMLFNQILEDLEQPIQRYIKPEVIQQ